MFDGKAAFACGDLKDALKSYALAAEIRDDHPAARRGAVEAAERLAAESSPESSPEASRVLADALREALRLPADEKQLTPARRVAWTEALAKACEASGNHAEARERWTALAVRAGFARNDSARDDSDDSFVSSLAMPDPSLVARALEGAARSSAGDAMVDERTASAARSSSSRDEASSSASAHRAAPSSARTTRLGSGIARPSSEHASSSRETSRLSSETRESSSESCV